MLWKLCVHLAQCGPVTIGSITVWHLIPAEERRAEKGRQAPGGVDFLWFLFHFSSLSFERLEIFHSQFCFWMCSYFKKWNMDMTSSSLSVSNVEIFSLFFLYSFSLSCLHYFPNTPGIARKLFYMDSRCMFCLLWGCVCVCTCARVHVL